MRDAHASSKVGPEPAADHGVTADGQAAIRRITLAPEPATWLRDADLVKLEDVAARADAAVLEHVASDVATRVGRCKLPSRLREAMAGANRCTAADLLTLRAEAPEQWEALNAHPPPSVAQATAQLAALRISSDQVHEVRNPLLARSLSDSQPFGLNLDPGAAKLPIHAQRLARDRIKPINHHLNVDTLDHTACVLQALRRLYSASRHDR